MYRIGILERDGAYLERLIGFLDRHHNDSFEINIVDADEADWGNLSLDDLDMDAVPYDALFFGDGVDTKEDIPANVIIGYLTESSDASDAGWINKYQSMEQIYKQMLNLCEGGKVSDTLADNPAGEQSDSQGEEPDNEFKVRDVTEDGETYRVWDIDDKRVDRLAIRMLTGNRIRGLPQITYKEGELRFRVTGMKCLCQYVQENNSAEGKQKLLKMFGGMLKTAFLLEEYMLSADRLILNPKEIYVDETKGEALMPYMPIKDGESKDAKQFLEDIARLCKMLVEEPDNGSTQIFDNLQKNAKESLKLKENAAVAAANEEQMPYIIRKKTGEKIRIDRNIFKLGKDASYVDYCIDDNPTVSRNHADIVRKPDGFYLIDKGSLNHTFVNGRKLGADECRKLKNGCLMQLADEVFQFIIKPQKA